MNELAASAIVLLVAPAFALGLFALRTLYSRTASSSRTLLPTSFTFFIAALAVATSTCNILASKDSAHASSTAAKISYACLKLFTGGAAMYLIQEPSLLRRLVAPFVFCSRHRVLSLLLLPSALLFVSTALSVDLAARHQSSSVTDISLDILIACLATICLLISCALFARQIRDELRLRSIWLVLLLAQIGGILAAAFELDTRYGQVLRSLFTTIWLVCTILALHLFILLPSPASFSPAVQCKGQMSSLRMRDTLKVPIGDTASRARHPSSPITPTEEYLRVQDPFASPPGSSLSHCQSFDDYDLEKLARLPERERTFCDPTLPVLLSQIHPSPRRGLASSPLPSFPRELTLHAQEARDSATSSSFDVKTLVSPLYPPVENQKAEEIAIKSRFRESFST